MTKTAKQNGTAIKHQTTNRSFLTWPLHSSRAKRRYQKTWKLNGQSPIVIDGTSEGAAMHDCRTNYADIHRIFMMRLKFPVSADVPSIPYKDGYQVLKAGTGSDDCLFCAVLRVRMCPFRMMEWMAALIFEMMHRYLVSTYSKSSFIRKPDYPKWPATSHPMFFPKRISLLRRFIRNLLE